MPSMRGTEKPQMSASSTPTVKPIGAIAAARLTVTELLPTPPLPEAMASTRVVAGIWVSGAFSRACQRALSITSERSSLVISPQSICTSRTPGMGRDAGFDVGLDLRAQRATADRELHDDRDEGPSPDGCGATVTDGIMPRSTTLPPSSGSMTPRSRP